MRRVLLDVDLAGDVVGDPLYTNSAEECGWQCAKAQVRLRLLRAGMHAGLQGGSDQDRDRWKHLHPFFTIQDCKGASSAWHDGARA